MKVTTRVEIDFHEEVERGAALLDEKFPGWHRRVDISGLRMSHIRYCILGQVFVEDFVNGLVKEHGSNYDGGADYLFGEGSFSDQPKAIEHGFSLPTTAVLERSPWWPNFAGPVYAAERDPMKLLWEILGQQWINKILELRAAEELASV